MEVPLGSLGTERARRLRVSGRCYCVRFERLVGTSNKGIIPSPSATEELDLGAI